MSEAARRGRERAAAGRVPSKSAAAASTNNPGSGGWGFACFIFLVICFHAMSMYMLTQKAINFIPDDWEYDDDEKLEL